MIRNSSLKSQLLPIASEGWGKVMFSVCPHLVGGGGYPDQVQREGYPRQVWPTGGGGTHPRYTPQPGQDGDPSQGGAHLQYPPPWPGHDWGCTPVRGHPSGVPLGQVKMGVTPARGHLPGVPPPPPGTGQHMEYLISGGRYASCVHTGGLSCLFVFARHLNCLTKQVPRMNEPVLGPTPTCPSQLTPDPPPNTLSKSARAAYLSTSQIIHLKKRDISDVARKMTTYESPCAIRHPYNKVLNSMSLSILGIAIDQRKTSLFTRFGAVWMGPCAIKWSVI